MNAPKPPPPGRWWQRLHHRLNGSALRRDLLRGGVGSLAVKSANAVLAFAVAVTLARVLGPEGYGVYAFALAILMIVALPVQVGMPQLVVRETAKAHASEDWALMRGLWRWATVAVLVLSGIALAGMVLFLMTQRGSMTPSIETLAVGALLIPVIALGNLRAASLRGLRRVVLGQLPEGMIRPLVLLCLLFLGLALGADEAIARPQTAMAFYVAAALVAFVAGAIMLRRARPEGVKQTAERRTEPAYWRRAVLPLAMITGLQLVNSQIHILLLGVFQTDEDVGIFRVVTQISVLLIFGFYALTQVFQPYYVRAYKQDKASLQKLVTLSSRAIFALALPPAMLIFLFPKVILSGIFGPEFIAGAMALVILSAGQLVNAFTGALGPLLNMTGHESITYYWVKWAAVVNICLGIPLIYLLGINGAAIAATASLVFYNFVLWLSVKSALSIDTLPVTLSRRKSDQ